MLCEKFRFHWFYCYMLNVYVGMYIDVMKILVFIGIV